MTIKNDLLSRNLSFQVVRRNKVSGEVDSRRLILRKGRVESKLHIILKVLTYLYFWEKDLFIEPNFRLYKYRPDLVSWRESEIPTKEEKIPDLWIECKHVKYKKLLKLSRALPHSKIIWMHTLRSLKRTISNTKTKTKLQRASNVQLIGIDTLMETWKSLEESISTKQNQWMVTLHERNLMTVSVEDQSINGFSVRFHLLLGNYLI